MIPSLAKRLLVAILFFAITTTFFLTQSRPAAADFGVVGEGFVRWLYQLSDDGRYLAYVKYGQGVMWQDLQSGEERLLLQESGNPQGAIYLSADNRTILRGTDNPYPTSLIQIDVETGQATTLLTGYEIHYGLDSAVTSADGRFVAFIAQDRYRDQLFVYDTQERTLNRRHTATLGTMSNVAITPDNSTLLVHDSLHGIMGRISAVPRISGDPIRLVSADAPIESLTLSPDGNTAYYFLPTTSGSQIHRVNVATGTTLALNDIGGNHSDIQFSPDGAYAFYAQTIAGQSIAFRLTTANGTSSVIFTGTTADASDLDIIVPDVGTRLIVLELDEGGEDIAIPIYSIPYAPIGAPQLLATDYGHIAYNRLPLIITPDGETLIYTQTGFPYFYLKQVAMDGTTAPELLYPHPTVQDVRLSITESGLYVNIADEETEFDTLYYMGIAERVPRLVYRTIDPTITTHNITLVAPIMDEEITFVSSEEPDVGVGTLWRAGTLPQVVVPYREIATLPEGASRQIELALLPVSTETITVTYSILSGTATLGDDFTLSPAQVVFAAGQPTATLTITALNDSSAEGLETSRLELRQQNGVEPQILDLSFNEIVALSDNPARLQATSADGRYALFHETTANQVGLYGKDIATGERYQLAAPDSTMTFDDAAALSPDGRTVLYTRGTNLFQVPFTGGASTLLLSTVCTPVFTFTTDSQAAQVASDCINSPDSIYAIDLQAADSRLLLNDIQLFGLPLATAPDGNTVVYQQEAQGEPVGLHIVPTDGAPPRYINAISDAAHFTTPTTLHYVRRTEQVEGDAYLINLNVVTGVRDDTASLGRYQGGVFFGTQARTIFYYRAAFIHMLHRYQLGAEQPAPVAPSGDKTTWLQLVANDSQLLYQEDLYNCGPKACVPQFYNLGTYSGDGVRQWRNEETANNHEVSADGRTVVYRDAHSPTPRFFRKVLEPLTPAEHEMTALTADITEWRMGSNRVFAVVGDTIEMSALYDDTAPIPAFRNNRVPRWDGKVEAPTLLKIFEGDLLYLQDADGYLYVLGYATPAANSATSETMVAEGESVTVTVTLASTPLTTATVAMNVVGGTATIGTDVSAPPATLTFAPFQREQSFTLTTTADGVTESVEELRFIFTPASGTSAGTLTTYRLRIADQLYRQRLPLMQEIQ